MEKKKNGYTRLWRLLSLLGAVLSGGWLVFYGLLLWLGPRLGNIGLSLSEGEAASLGIIGGADGPTSILVSTFVISGGGLDPDLAVMAGIFALSLFLFLRLGRSRKDS